MPTFSLYRVRSNGQLEMPSGPRAPDLGLELSVEQAEARYGPPEYVVLDVRPTSAALMAVHGFYVLTWEGQ